MIALRPGALGIRSFSFQASPARGQILLKDAETPERLKVLCRDQSHNFNEKHWMAIAAAIDSFTKQGLRNEVLQLVEDLDGGFAPRVDSRLSISAISHISWIFGKIGINDPEFIKTCKKIVSTQTLKGATTEDLTKLAWSQLLMLNWDEELLRRIANAVEKQLKLGVTLKEEESFRLLPVSLAGRVKWDRQILGSSTAYQIQTLLERRRLVMPTGSKFQAEVTDAIIKLAPSDWHWEREYFHEGYHFDLACQEKLTSFEIDGPFHFYPGTRELIARDRLMDLLFEGLGWRIKRISCWDWAEAGSLEKKEELLASKLRN